MTIAWPLAPIQRARGDAARWGTSLALVVAAHALAITVLLTWRTPVAPVVTAAPAVMIDLAPPPVVKPPPPQPVQETIPEPLPTPAPKPAVVLPPPKPKPKVVQKVEPPPQVEPTPVAPPPPQVAVAPSAPPSPARQTMTPSYEGLLMAQLERNKRYPRSARMHRQEGTATLRFTVARDGKLVAFKLERSSGVPALDEEVLAMIERAAPLPPFPPEMTQASLELVVPVRFSLR